MANVVDPIVGSPWATPVRDEAIAQAARAIAESWVATLSALYPGFSGAVYALTNAYGSLTWSGTQLTTFRENIASAAVSPNAAALRQLSANQTGLAAYINSVPYNDARPTSLGKWYQLPSYVTDYLNPYVNYVIQQLSAYWANQPAPTPITVPPIKFPSG